MCCNTSIEPRFDSTMNRAVPCRAVPCRTVPCDHIHDHRRCAIRAIPYTFL